MATHSSILSGKSYGQRSLTSYSQGGRKESDTTESLTHTHTHNLNKYSHSERGEMEAEQPSLDCGRDGPEQLFTE